MPPRPASTPASWPSTVSSRNRRSVSARHSTSSTLVSTLINAKVSLVGAQRDAVVASYSILSAMGRLDREHIGLKVAAYKPEEHYNQVRDAWGGLRRRTATDPVAASAGPPSPRRYAAIVPTKQFRLPPDRSGRG